MMERYRFSEQEQAVLEGLKTPLAVFQLVDGQAAAVALSDGLLRAAGA